MFSSQETCRYFVQEIFRILPAVRWRCGLFPDHEELVVQYKGAQLLVSDTFLPWMVKRLFYGQNTAGTIRNVDTVFYIRRPE